jgi:hypothetical protein
MATSKKYLCATLLLFVVGTMAAQANGQDKIRLKDYQWKNRLILAFSPSAEDTGYRAFAKDIVTCWSFRFWRVVKQNWGIPLYQRAQAITSERNSQSSLVYLPFC